MLLSNIKRKYFALVVHFGLQMILERYFFNYVKKHVIDFAEISKEMIEEESKRLKITMKKHPDSLKLEGSLKEILQNKLPLKEPLIIYEGFSD